MTPPVSPSPSLSIYTPYQCGLMMGWIDCLLIAGNHLAVALNHLPIGWESWNQEEALEKLAGTSSYDVWVAWKAAMRVSKARRTEFGEDRAF
jgi:hypothetical protein